MNFRIGTDKHELFSALSVSELEGQLERVLKRDESFGLFGTLDKLCLTMKTPGHWSPADAGPQRHHPGPEGSTEN